MIKNNRVYWIVNGKKQFGTVVGFIFDSRGQDTYAIIQYDHSFIEKRLADIYYE